MAINFTYHRYLTHTRTKSKLLWSTMSSASVAPVYFILSRINATIYQEISEHFMLLSLDKLYGDADFHFDFDFVPVQSARTTSYWFADHGITVLDWPSNLA